MKPSAASSRLRGRTVLVTSGPTRERLDPVRFLTNASSGAMGFALAAEARRRGARVIVVSGPVFLPPPPGVELVDVESALEMRRETLRRVRRADVVIGAAAVGDWRFAAVSKHKLKRSRTARSVNLTLVPNPDIIKEVASSARRPSVVVGFALETRDAVASAKRKLAEKNLDLVVANGAQTLASPKAKAWLVSGESVKSLPSLAKPDLAKKIFDAVERMLEP